MAKRAPRQVVVTWIGSASEVRVCGSFDSWGQGVHMSNTDYNGSGDSVLHTFTAQLSLTPGKYHIKFKVDDEWRLAPGWPTEDAEDSTNNVLDVA
mmetsp:Transcript_22409/g.38283  ORF Transcript_22409/g.38283 Transcript_22409/m.38283 type:complete len:95 (-) Transcript_22409:90-374(-)